MIDNMREANADVTVRAIDTGHSPMLSKPLETTTVISDAAKAFIAVRK
jgi:hypothetical protein